MFEQAVQASEAVRASTGSGGSPLLPALCGCISCGAVRMIASPTLGTCECGEPIVALEAPNSASSADVLPDAA
jgi:hypothetical protein